MDLGLTGRIAIVTGASKGIGKAIALGLAQEGASICLVSRTAETLARTAGEIRTATGRDVVPFAGDVADPGLPERLLDYVQKKWGAPHILVNNAGGPPPGSFVEHDDAAWDQALQQNFLSAVRMTRAVAPLMKRQRWGRIVNITSTVAKEPSPTMVLSASARAAVSAFSKAISIELAPFNVTVNCLGPGSVRTDRATSLIEQAAARENKPFDEVLKRTENLIPAERLASPDEIADVAVFLVCQRAGYLTGTTLMVDGGLSKGVF